MTVNPGPWLTKEGLKIGHLNINHAVNKLCDICTIISNGGKNFHIFGFSESRLSDHITDADISVPGYSTVRRDSQLQKETGLLVYINQSISFKRLSHLENNHIESVWLEIYLKRSKPVLIGFIYRNPTERVDWFDRFNLMMDAVANESKETILLGDFNIDLLKTNKHWEQTYEIHNIPQSHRSPPE